MNTDQNPRFTALCGACGEDFRTDSALALNDFREEHRPHKDKDYLK